MPSHSEAVAKSYAKALFELARERNQVDAVGKELDAVAQLMTDQPAMLDFLSRPWVGTPAKRGAATEIASRAAPQDSLDTIGYEVEAEFAEDGLTGRYSIRAPDLNALSAGSGAGRCEYVYEVRGRPLIEGRPRPGEPPAGLP